MGWLNGKNKEQIRDLFIVWKAAAGTPVGRSDGSLPSNAQETERPARPGPTRDTSR